MLRISCVLGFLQVKKNKQNKAFLGSMQIVFLGSVQEVFLGFVQVLFLGYVQVQF